MALLDGGQPSVLAVGGGQDAAGDAVGAVEVGSHLLLKILEAVKAQGLIEPLVVVTVASFHLAVMSRRSRLDQLVSDAVVPAESVHRVEPVGLSDVGEFRSVIGLEDLRDVPEMLEGFSDEVDCTVAALLPVGTDKSGFQAMSMFRHIDFSSGRAFERCSDTDGQRRSDLSFAEAGATPFLFLLRYTGYSVFSWQCPP